MSNGKALLLIVGAGVLSAFLAFGLFGFILDYGEEEEEYLGLGSTEITLEQGEEYHMSVWSLPKNCSYEDIEWDSDDESIAKVVSGTITAKNLGTCTINANVGDRHETCLVHVVASKENILRTYDAYSEEHDYAVLSGNGFEKGILSLSFNPLGKIIISLSGYDPSWKGNGFLGAVAADFKTVRMTVTDSTGKIVKTSTYNNSNQGGNVPGLVGAVSSADAYNALIDIDRLPYGTYDVTFSIRYLGSHSVSPYDTTVTSSFELCEGNGRYDSSGTFVRTYNWRCDPEGTSGTGMYRSMTVEYDYGSYWDYRMLNSTKVFVYHDAIRNSMYMKDAVGLCQISPNVEKLLDALKQEYTSAYGSADYSGQRFAQFVSTFAQVCFEYEYDTTQYDKVEKTGDTDYWAYPDETIYSRFGDCEDTSILISTLLKAAGYDVGLVLFDNHMTSAVKLTEYDNLRTRNINGNTAFATYDDDHYYFVESTANAPVTEETLTGVRSYLVGPSEINTSCKHGYYFVGMVSNSLVGTEFTFLKA